MNKKGQIAIEFTILLFMSAFIVLVLLVSIKSISNNKLRSKALNELDDLGKSLQKELVLASELEPGYSRELYVPYNLYGKDFELNLSNVSSTIKYLDFYYEDRDLFYAVPVVQGDIKKGYNKINNIEGELFLTQ